MRAVRRSRRRRRSKRLGAPPSQPEPRSSWEFLTGYDMDWLAPLMALLRGALPTIAATIVSRPLEAPSPTIDLVLGHDEGNTSSLRRMLVVELGSMNLADRLAYPAS